MVQRPVLVTGGIIVKDGSVLIAQRHPASHFEPEKWEFPGGKVDFSEHPEETLVRELTEELGIVVKPGRLYHVASHVYDQNGLVRHVVILFYLCDIVEGDPSPIDCLDVRWVSRDDLSSYVFVGGDSTLLAAMGSDDDLWVNG